MKYKTKYKKTGMSFIKKFFVFILIVGVVAGGAYLAINSGMFTQGTVTCDHEWVERRQDNALVSVADCTHSAVYYKSCAKCNEISTTLTFEYDEPLGHTVVTEAKSEYLVTAASCTRSAVYKSYCSVCNEALETFEYGEPLGHDYAEITTKEYRISVQSCTKPEEYYLSCSRCGVKHEDDYTFKVKEPLGHTWVEEIHKDHRISELGCELDEVYHKSCSTCNANHESEIFTVATATGHNYIEQVNPAYVVSAATCEDAAVYAKSCENCGKKHESETFVYGDPIGHDFQNVQHKDFLVNPGATCGDTPEYYVTCTHCKEHKEDDATFVGEKLEHVLNDVAEVEATKTEHGAKAHKVCTECGAFFDTEGNSITEPEAIHNYEWCENAEHTHHYKACTVEGCTAPHTDEAEHTYDEEGCDTTCNGGCGFERESQHVDTNGDGVCEKCESNVFAPEVPKDEGDEDEDNFTDWMPL